MIRRLLLVVALGGMIGAFSLTVRDIFRLADRACLGWQAEARGNCEGFASYYALNDTLIFSVFSVLLIVVLLFNLKSTDK